MLKGVLVEVVDDHLEAEDEAVGVNVEEVDGHIVHKEEKNSGKNTIVIAKVKMDLIQA